MGASGWDYRAPYAGSVEQTLPAVQEQTLASGDYRWRWEDIDPEYVDEAVPRPASLSALEEAEFWEAGTHTILRHTTSPRTKTASVSSAR
ncbi:hypothetical protein [Amycolatopsis sp.]|uniref:hypothetical protein n=1 Tax=Amycolatopsis sp. TaxID=37632 RepID=UPI002D80B4B5|nr:hypothetical protein [Amycolatopsis sp.]